MMWHKIDTLFYQYTNSNNKDDERVTVQCRYNAVHFITISHTGLRWQRQNIRNTLISHQAPKYHTLGRAKNQECERKYKNTQMESDKLLLKEQRNKYKNLLNFTKKDYIKSKTENVQSSKDLYKICDKMLDREQRSALP